MLMMPSRCPNSSHSSLCRIDRLINQRIRSAELEVQAENARLEAEHKAISERDKRLSLQTGRPSSVGRSVFDNLRDKGSIEEVDAEIECVGMSTDFPTFVDNFKS